MSMEHIKRSLRGSTALRNVRAEGNDLGEIKAMIKSIGELQASQKKTFEDFKVEVEAKTKDVVQSDKVERINTALEVQAKAIDDLNASLAAFKVAGGGGSAKKRGDSPAGRVYASAFDTWFRKGKGEEALRDLAIRAELAVGSDPDGGYTVTPEMDQEIDRVLPNVSAIRGLATVMTIGTSKYKKLFNKAGTTTGWVGETDTRATTNTPQLAGQDYPVMEIFAQPAATQELLDDSFVDIAQWLATECAIVFAEQEGLAFAQGTGSNQPKGILAYNTVVDATFAAGTSANWGNLGYIATGAAADFAAVAQADCLFDLEDALKTGYQPNARWLMNRKTRSAIRKFKNSLGDYLWQPGLQIGIPDTLDGKPITIDDNIPNIGAGSYPIAYGDFKRGYLIVDRIGVRVLRDNLTQKPYVLFYTTKRVGGGVQNFEAIKLLKVAVS